MRIVPALLLLLVVSSTVAGDPALSAHDGWIREAPPVAPVRAGYLRLRNDGAVDLTIVAARSPSFAAVEIHEMITADDGGMRMRPLPALAVPAGTTIELKPGGLHFMLQRPRHAPAPGEQVPISLILADGSEIETTLEQR